MLGAQLPGYQGNDTLPLKRSPLFTVSDRTEVPAQQLLADSSSQPPAILERMTIVEARIDTGPKDLSE
jgi:hypothetical protein